MCRFGFLSTQKIMYKTCVSSEEVLDLTALSSLHEYVLIHVVRSEGGGSVVGKEG